MKGIAIIALGFILPTVSLAQYTVQEYQAQLDRVFKPADDDTVTQQIIYGSIQAVAIYKLGTYITSPDKKAIISISTQIEALKDKKAAQYFPQDTMTDGQRKARIRQLESQLRTIEGNIFQRMGRGVAKFIIRGAQVFLLIDIGSRIYVLSTLDEKDPGFIPSYTLFCTGFDCSRAVNEVIRASNEAFEESHRLMNQN